MTLPYSDAIFVCAFPRECTEAFLEGHVRAFAFFGGVPRRISYDNSQDRGRQDRRQRGTGSSTREFLRLKSHYLFEDHFCLVRRPNEKGHVETLVGFARRNFLVPVPAADRWRRSTPELAGRCRADLARAGAGQAGDQGRRCWPRSGRRCCRCRRTAFEAAAGRAAAADSLSLVRFDANDYSVPTAYAHQPVTVVGGGGRGPARVPGPAGGPAPAVLGREQVTFDPVHYLALLERKPGAFDFARPLEGWELPESLRRAAAAAGGRLGRAGERQFIQVLRLLERRALGELTARGRAGAGDRRRRRPTRCG